MPKESDRTGKPVPTPQKPILLEDINETPPPPDGAGPEYATDLPGYPADPDFQLRGGYDNLMLDAASQLFGLVIRLRTLDDLPNIQFVHKTVQTQVSTIREEMRQHGYCAVHQEVYSYALCLHLDEAVMTRPWGQNSCWSHEPLLSIFHDETQGGEKIFVLLERIMQSPKEFQDVLEFLYFCFCLGLQGKYALDPKGDEILSALISRMHKVIRQLRGPTPQTVSDPIATSSIAPTVCAAGSGPGGPRWSFRSSPWSAPTATTATASTC